MDTFKTGSLETSICTPCVSLRYLDDPTKVENFRIKCLRKLNATFSKKWCHGHTAIEELEEGQPDRCDELIKERGTEKNSDQ